jgi:hypothetical protein
MNDLALLSRGVVRWSGSYIARCNWNGSGMTSSQIQQARAQPIEREAYADAMTLWQERFDREMSAPLMQFNYELLASEMGQTEFVAAFRDAMATKMFFADLIPFLIEHVKKQRDDGPDLWALDFAEVGDVDYG